MDINNLIYAGYWALGILTVIGIFYYRENNPKSIYYKGNRPS